MAIPHPKLPPPPSVALSHRPSHPSKQLHSKLSHIPSLMPQTSHIRKTYQPSTTREASSLSTVITKPEETRQRPLQDTLPNRWREIHGCDDWVGLLDPMDPLLRSELIRYGEFAQACYDAFDYDPFSLNCGSCKYDPLGFFPSLGMDSCGYDIARYLYATSNISLPNFFSKSGRSKNSREPASWIGYVAVSNDDATARLGRRDIVVAWRGTVTRLEWATDLMDFLGCMNSKGIPCPDPTIKAMSGFVHLYMDKDATCSRSARQQVLTEVRKLVGQYTRAGETVSISVAGHSLGSALGMLSAYDIAETGADIGFMGEMVPVCVFSFSGPRVGNWKFKERFEELGVKALRVVNKHDTVPKVPGFLVNERSSEVMRNMAEWLPWSYSHVGIELALDHTKSTFLKDTRDLSCFHNLEALLHLLDGYHGRGQRFMVNQRDPALVNKACDFLKDYLNVPPRWRQDENKGMVRSSDGRWVQPKRQTMDDQPLDI